MKYYQPYGGGVNSLALKLLLIEQGRDCEAAFVNHGGDLPETQAHVKTMIEKEFNLTELRPTVEGYTDIYEFYYQQKIVPFVFLGRSCTAKWKTRPQRQYYKPKGEPYTLFIGFDSGEKHRANIESKLKKVSFEYPLIDAGLRRRDCISLIKDNELEVPVKSDCFFCPYHSKERWWGLARDHPELFWKAVALEENSGGPRLVRKGWLRNLWPPPQTFEMVDIGCNQCLFGITEYQPKEEVVDADITDD